MSSRAASSNGLDLYQEEGQEQSSKDQKNRPTKYLPTARIKFSNQLEILRAFTALSGPTAKPATVVAVAKILNMVPSTVSMANPFFVDIGFLQKSESGFTPAQELFNYARAQEWNPETAPHKLAPLLEQTWFMNALAPRLSLRPLKEEDAIAVLAEACSAGPEYKSRLQVILEYLAVSGLISRENGEIRLIRNAPNQVADKPSREETATPKPPESRDMPAPRPNPPASGTQFTGGAVQFHVSVRVDMDEFASWDPARIQAFFAGIAQVLAAKKALVRSNEITE
jgi:hypothetical protein